MKQYTLSKTERLYLRDAIGDLFAKGSGFMVFPYRVIYRILGEDDPQVARVAIMTIAPKKRFKHAVDRNRAKRICRESYRVAKLPLLEVCREHHCKLAFALLYCDNRQLSLHDAQQRMAKIIHTLSRKVVEAAGGDPNQDISNSQQETSASHKEPSALQQESSSHRQEPCSPALAASQPQP